jgi:hypothetical protein
MFCLPGVVYNVEALQFEVLEDTTDSNHKAILGPLTGSDVKVFSLSDFDNPIITTTTDKNGSFDLDNIQSLSDNDYYLISGTQKVCITNNSDKNRVFRGGSWLDDPLPDPWPLRTAYRAWKTHGSGYGNVGFRVSRQ